MVNRKRLLILLAVFVYLVSWPVVILLDPSMGHGPQGGEPPLWGWWMVGSALAPVVGLTGWFVWMLIEWVFERRDPHEVERNIERLEREVGIR